MFSRSAIRLIISSEWLTATMHAAAIAQRRGTSCANKKYDAAITARPIAPCNRRMCSRSTPPSSSPILPNATSRAAGCPR